MTTSVISIQRQVVHGLNVAAVPTTLLSNHPGFETMRGRVLESELVGDLLRGVEERGLIETSRYIISGYLGSRANGDAVAAFVKRLAAGILIGRGAALAGKQAEAVRRPPLHRCLPADLHDPHRVETLRLEVEQETGEQPVGVVRAAIDDRRDVRAVVERRPDRKHAGEGRMFVEGAGHGQRSPPDGRPTGSKPKRASVACPSGDRIASISPTAAGFWRLVIARPYSGPVA